MLELIEMMTTSPLKATARDTYSVLLLYNIRGELNRKNSNFW